MLKFDTTLTLIDIVKLTNWYNNPIIDDNNEWKLILEDDVIKLFASWYDYIEYMDENNYTGSDEIFDLIKKELNKFS